MTGIHSREHWKVVCKSKGKEYPYIFSEQCEVSYGQLTGIFFSCIQLKSSPSWTKALSWWRDLCNSMMLLAMLCRATQGWQVIMESSDRMTHGRREWQTTPIFFPWESHELYKKAKRYDAKTWVLQVGRCPVCYWEEQRTIYNIPERMKQLGQSSLVDVSGDESKSSAIRTSIA